MSFRRWRDGNYATPGSWTGTGNGARVVIFLFSIAMLENNGFVDCKALVGPREAYH